MQKSEAQEKKPKFSCIASRKSRPSSILRRPQLDWPLPRRVKKLDTKKSRQKSVGSNLETVDREEYSWSLEKMVFGCKLKLGGTFRYFVLGGFSEPSVC